MSQLEPVWIKVFNLICFISLPVFCQLISPIFTRGVFSCTQSRPRLADSSTDMILPDPRPVVAPIRQRKHARHPDPTPPVLEIKDRGDHGRKTKDILGGPKSWGLSKSAQMSKFTFLWRLLLSTVGGPQQISRTGPAPQPHRVPCNANLLLA